MATTYESIQTHVTKDDNQVGRRMGQLQQRITDINAYAQRGYVLAHTATIDGAEFFTFVDTLARTREDY